MEVIDLKTMVRGVYIYEASDKTACFITGTLLRVGDRVRYLNGFEGTVTRTIWEEADKKFKKQGAWWQEISVA